MRPENDEMINAARQWHKSLDTGDRAQLRRCRTVHNALMLRPTLDLMRRVGGHAWPRRAAALAVILAHVKADDPRPMMRVVGRQRFGSETAILSQRRFERLIQARGPDELITALVRVVRLMGGQCSIADLTEALRWWSDRTREQWAATYFAATEVETNPTE